MKTDTELPALAGIGAIIHWLEELASLLAGPILTAGLGIALIDLLTDGRLLASMPVLLFAWSASQAVGLDAQLVGSAAKVGASLRGRRWWAALGFTLLVIALGAVAYQASSVFAIQQADGITTAQALAQLGMDTATWLLERSALAVVLVILSGLLRYAAPAKQRPALADERADLERQLELEPLRQRLRAQQVGGLRALAVTALQGASVAQSAQTGIDDRAPIEASQRLPTHALEGAGGASAAEPVLSLAGDGPEKPPTGGGSPAVASKRTERTERTERTAGGNVTPIMRRGLGRAPRQTRKQANRANARSGHRGRAEQRIRQALAAEPDITPERLATRAGVSSSTVSKWLAVIATEHRQVAQGEQVAQ